MRQLLLILIFLQVLFLNAQENNFVEVPLEKDFLELVSNETDVCGKAQHYLLAGQSNKDSNLYYVTVAGFYGQKCTDYALKAKISSEFAEQLVDYQEYEKALIHYQDALTNYGKINDTSNVAYIYLAIGGCYKRMQKYLYALKSYDISASYFSAIDHFSGIAQVDLSMASIYKNLGRLDEAKVRYQSSLKIFQQLGNSGLVIKAQNNLANVFKKEEQYDSAFFFYYNAKNSIEKNGPKRNLSYLYQNLANLHVTTGNLDSAAWYLNQSVSLKKQFGDFEDLVSDYVIYGDIYMMKEEYSNAILNYEKARVTLLEYSPVDNDYEISFELAKAYYKVNDFKKSAENYSLYFEQLDALRLDNPIFEMEQGFIHYEFYKDSVEAEKLKTEHELQKIRHKNEQLSSKSIKSQLYFILGILALLIVMLALLFISFRKRLQQEKEHQTVLALQNEELKRTLVSKEEKETLLKEIHHRVKNNLQIISSLIRLQSGYINEYNFKERLNEIENRILSMALVHEKLYQSNDLSRLEVKSYIKDLSINILESYQTRKRVTFIFDIDATEFTIDTLIPIGLILNETISNALKHAFFDREKGTIKVSLKRKESGEVMLEISDDGIGADLSVEELKKDSLGMDLIFSLTDQLDGELNIDTRQGFIYNFAFPNLA